MARCEMCYVEQEQETHLSLKRQLKKKHRNVLLLLSFLVLVCWKDCPVSGQQHCSCCPTPTISSYFTLRGSPILETDSMLAPT